MNPDRQVKICGGRIILKNEPIRHHYVPQFILRNFSNEKGFVNYFDKTTNMVTSRETRNVFMERNLYRDEINYIENPTQIETDLSRFEREISQILREKFYVGDRIFLTKEDDEKLKLFFAIMGFRSYSTMFQFSKGMKSDSKKMYSQYQNNGDLQDLWKRNLGYLINCRSLEDVLGHKEIDAPIKFFMSRDVCGLFDQHWVVLEKKEGNSFIIGDVYPTVVTGTTTQGSILRMYSINPISPSRVILLVENGVENTPSHVLGFRQTILYKPQWNSDKQVTSIRVKKIYPEEVKGINNSIANAAQKGIVFYKEK